MIIIDKKTNKRITNNLIVDTTEDIVWGTWIIWNTTLIVLKPELILPKSVTLVSRLPETIAPGERVDIDVKIDTTLSIRESIKLIPHGTKVSVN